MKELKEFTVERLEQMVSSIKAEWHEYAEVYDNISHREIAALAKIALAAKRVEPVGEVRLSEYDSDGCRQGSITCLHDQADWDNFPNGTKLYTSPPLNHTEQDGWIKCSERTPEDSQWCAVRAEYGYYIQCWGSEQGWLGDEISIPNCDVTHWVPLPAAPKPEM